MGSVDSTTRLIKNGLVQNGYLGQYQGQIASYQGQYQGSDAK